MSQIDRYSRCQCQNCGGSIEFPAEGAGETVECPHCNWKTVLAAETEQATPSPPTPRRKLRWWILLDTVAVLAVIGWFWFYTTKAPKPTIAAAPTARLANSNSALPTVVKIAIPVIEPDPWRGLKAGSVKVEKSGAGHLVYAVGEVRNESDHERFGVKVELDVLDAQGEKVGAASDYTQSIDTGKTWRFRALVTDRNGVAAKIASVKED